MRARWTLLSALAIASVAVAGCGPKVKPGLGVVGDKTTARFDRAMVTDDKLGVDVADPPVKLKPSVPGKFRWLDTRTLAFVADEPLPRSTRFEVAARADTRALDGLGLAKAVAWSFETERLRVTLGSPGRWATPDQRISVGFNQPVRRRDVEKRCAYVSDGKRVAAVVDDTGEAEETRDTFVALPHEPLALGAKWRFECGVALTGAEGPLGLEAPSTQAFETYGPLKVTSVAPRGGEISPDEASIVITFSNPVAASAAAVSIKVQPAIEGFPERAAVVEDRVSYTVRALQPNTRYTITVDAGRRQVRTAPGGAARRRVRHRRRHAAPGRRDGRVGRRGDAPGIPGLGAEPDVARGRHHRRTRGEAGRACGAARLVGPGDARRQEGRPQDEARHHPDPGPQEPVGSDPDRAREAAGRRGGADRLLLHRAPRARGAAPGRGRSAPARDAAQLHEPRRHREAVWTIGAGMGDASFRRPAAAGRRRLDPRRQGQGSLARDDRRGRDRGDAGTGAAAPQAEARAAQQPRGRRSRRGWRRRRGRGRLRRRWRLRGPAQRGPAGVRPPRQGQHLGQPGTDGRAGGVELSRPGRHVGPRRAAARLPAYRSRPLSSGRYGAGEGAGPRHEAGIGAARAGVAQGARHRARSPRRAAVGEERCHQSLRWIRPRRPDQRGGAARRLPRRGVDAGRRVPRALLGRAVPRRQLRGEGRPAGPRPDRRRGAEADGRGPLPLRRAVARRRADLAGVPPVASDQLRQAARLRLRGRAPVGELVRLALGRVGAAGR